MRVVLLNTEVDVSDTLHMYIGIVEKQSRIICCKAQVKGQLLFRVGLEKPTAASSTNTCTYRGT